MEYILEQEKSVPVVGHYDVVVCGGGPAGVCAAIAAGRTGAKVMLIEAMGCLGGTWTSSLMGFMIDVANKSGIVKEIEAELNARNAIKYYTEGGRCFTFDIEEMKLVLEDLCAVAGVELLYHTRVTAAVTEKRQLTHVIIESKSGRQAVDGKRFIDCSGDGDLAALAGCSYEMGEPETGKTQPMSFLVLLDGINAAAVEPFIGGGSYEPKQLLLEAFHQAGLDPSYGSPTLFKIHDDLFWMMANHQYGVSALSAADVTRATIEGRQEVFKLVAALRSLGEPWSNVRIVGTSAYIGVREGRRINGLYEVSIEDLIAGKKHQNAVCEVSCGVDVHSVDPKNGKGCNVKTKIKIKPAYDIPAESLISRDIDNLMMAGRCICGDFFSHSSYRISGNAAMMGEFSGIVSASKIK
jgi:hypothetical protein